MKNDIQVIFGRILQGYRVQQKLSQERLAELANLDRTYISQIERGLKSPSFKTLLALAQALHIKASILVSDVEDALDRSPEARS